MEDEQITRIKKEGRKQGMKGLWKEGGGKEVCLASSGINGSIAQQIADSLNPAGRPAEQTEPANAADGSL